MVDVEVRAGDGASASVVLGGTRSPTPVAAAVGTMDLGPMCRADFKVSKGTTEVCGAVGDFVAAPLLQKLFRKMPLGEMLQSIEANAVKVCVDDFFYR